MTDRPILFSGPMIKAILAGTKTQTRRTLKAPKWSTGVQDLEIEDEDGGICAIDTQTGCFAKVPLRWTVGDRLWVKETWADVNTESGPALLYRAGFDYHFCADDAYPVEYERYPGCLFSMWCSDLLRGSPDHKWRSPRYMPKWASRTTLEVTGVRVERLQDISEADAIAEGVEPPETERVDHDWSICPQCGGTGLYNGLGANLGVMPDCDCFECDTYVKRYQHLWNHINRPGSWESNPWVVVIEFRRVTQ
jgi:hypothetical protein